MKTWLLIALIVCTLHTCTPHYSNKILTNSSGLFYEKIGQARVSTANLTLVLHLNISQLEEARVSLSRQYDDIKLLCQRFSKEFSKNANIGYRCQETMQLISQNINNMKKFELKQLPEIMKVNSSTKIHRGVFNGVSHSYRWLHGEPDNDDPQYHLKILKMFINKQNLHDSQVIVIPTIFDMCNEITRSSECSIKNFQQLSNSNSTIMTNYYESHDSTARTTFLDSILPDYLSVAQLVSRRIDCEYKTYYLTINGVKNHRSLKETLGYEILLRELNKYKGIYKLPLSVESSDPKDIYKYLYMPWQMIAIDTSIVLMMKLPLLEPITYDLYNTYPLPIQRDEKTLFSYIQPNEAYFLVSSDKTKYSSLSTLSNCFEYQSKQYICTNLKPAVTAEQPICEALLMSADVSEIPEICDVTTIRAESETWKYVGNNQWIYVLQRPTSLRII